MSSNPNSASAIAVLLYRVLEYAVTDYSIEYLYKVFLHSRSKGVLLFPLL